MNLLHTRPGLLVAGLMAPLSAYHASEVYRLLGKRGLDSQAPPPVGEAIVRSDVGYHNRPGGHSVELSDWQRFIEFAEFHLQR